MAGLYKAVTDCLKISELTKDDLPGAQLVLTDWLRLREGDPPPPVTQAQRVQQMQQAAAAQRAAAASGRPVPPPPSPPLARQPPPPPSRRPPPPPPSGSSAPADDPYAVMNVPKDATSGAIRKAFRALSLLYHPDKNVGDETAANRFVEIAAAYEIIGNPDRRAAFDDFGVQGDMAAEAGGAGFDSYHEYQSSGKTATKDFYSGEAFVTNLNGPLWEKRGVSSGSASGDALWMVEFYAPWCSHCMRGVPQYKRAAVALDGVVEFGAVNCDKAHQLCNAQGIKSFPKFLLYSPKYEWSEEYPKGRLKELGKSKDEMGEDIVEWVRLVLPPFVPGFGHMLRNAGSGGDDSEAVIQTGRAQLLDWPGPWLLLCVAGHDPARCHSCNDAKPNVLRLAAELATGSVTAAGAPAFTPRVGIVDCTEPVMGAVCRELGPGGVSSEGFPHYVLVPAAVPVKVGEGAEGADEWQAAEKEEVAQPLRLSRALVGVFDPEELPAHLALPLIGTTLRLLAPAAAEAEAGGDGEEDEGDDEGGAVAIHREDEEDSGYQEEDRPPPPPPPQPQPRQAYYEPRARPGFAVGGRTQNGANVRAVGGGG